MRSVHPSIERSAQDQPCADARSDRNAKKAFSTSASPPSCLAESDRVSVIFHSNGQGEDTRKPIDWIATFPTRKEFDFADHSGAGINGASAANPNPRDINLKIAFDRIQHLCGEIHYRLESERGVGGTLPIAQNLACTIDNAHGDLGSTNVNGTKRVSGNTAHRSES
jgi:hypothetical protein